MSASVPTDVSFSFGAFEAERIAQRRAFETEYMGTGLAASDDLVVAPQDTLEAL